jgi:two-component SAPR family response regulator
MVALNLDVGRWQLSLSVARSAPTPATRAEPLSIYALGPFEAKRTSGPIEQWGGPKAGRRQGLGLFAFLYDRGEHGVGRDEAIDLIWPDVDYRCAELAFHRTLGGLRRTLGPGLEIEAAIGFRNGRYRVDPGLIGWSDVAEFERLCCDASQADGEQEVGLLEQARGLYRGEYLDDCPYYGDSAEVEARRAELRSLAVASCERLAMAYERRGLYGLAHVRRADAAQLLGCVGMAEP